MSTAERHAHPERIGSHIHGTGEVEQVFYVGDDGLLRHLDYTVDVGAGA